MAVRTFTRAPLASGKAPQPLVFAANLASRCYYSDYGGSSTSQTTNTN